MIVLTGCNGQLGGRIADTLISRLADVSSLAVTTRNVQTAKAKELKALGVDVRQADFCDPDSLCKAFEGAAKMLMISTFSPNEERIGQHRNAVEAATKVGVGHLFYTSFVNPTPTSVCDHAKVHMDTEERIRASGLTYTILRNSLYAENLVYDLHQTIGTGRLLRAGGKAKAAMIGRDDLAVWAASALLTEGHENKTYEGTGVRSLSYYDSAEILSSVFGRKISYVELTPDGQYNYFLSIGIPEYMAEGARTGARALLKGEYDFVTDDVMKITGMPPRSLPQLFADKKTEFLKMYAQTDFFG